MEKEFLEDKKMKQKNSTFRYKISLIILALALVFVGVFATYAFFQTPGENNQNASVNVKAGNMELIFSDGNSGFSEALDFGVSAKKTFTIKNNGSTEAVAKINWKNLTNTYLDGSLTYSFSYSENEGDEQVEVITNKNVPRSEEVITVELANGLVIPVGKTYTLTLTIKLNDLPVDQTNDLSAELRTEFSIEEGTKEENLIKEIFAKKNDISITDYNSGNKGEMFTFTHPEAEQTTGWSDYQRTDYRYIGKTPNNYIQFNNETWRIIGVFTVEGENGVKEQRIKIIRDQSIGDLQWNKSRPNDWSKSSLLELLDMGDYFNRSGSYSSTGLTDLAKSQISLTKWYLGGINNNYNLNGTDYYNFERGTLTYSNYSTNILAKVGLMYPSDYIYTFPDFNRDSHDSSWLFNSMSEWTISAQTLDDEYAYRKNEKGGITTKPYSAIEAGAELGGGVYTSDEVRPCVYLQPNIEIIGGDGTASSPYILKS